MDAVRILGDLLGNRHVSRGRGTSVLEGILGGAGPGGRRPMRQQPRAHARGAAIGNNPLGGLIRAAVEGYARHRAERDHDRHHDDHHRHDHHRERYVPPPSAGPCRFPDDRNSANQQAQLMIRAMVYAARADGCLDRREQENIVSRMGYLSPEEKQFLQYEFSRPLDTRGFAREVPPGLEDEIYAISLTAIDLDTNQEARYLHDLAHELELSHQEANYIHQQVGVRTIF